MVTTVGIQCVGGTDLGLYKGSRDDGTGPRLARRLRMLRAKAPWDLAVQLCLERLPLWVLSPGKTE